MPHAVLRHLFAYGTLRAGGSNDIRRFVPAPQRMGEVSIAGVLYDLGTYPGLVLGGATHVRGEVYRISPKLEAALDRLEAVVDDDSGEYIKREVEVMVGRGALRCLVYEIHPSRIVGRPVIASGDWFDRPFSEKES